MQFFASVSYIKPFFLILVSLCVVMFPWPSDVLPPPPHPPVLSLSLSSSSISSCRCISCSSLFFFLFVWSHSKVERYNSLCCRPFPQRYTSSVGCVSLGRPSRCETVEKRNVLWTVKSPSKDVGEQFCIWELSPRRVLTSGPRRRSGPLRSFQKRSDHLILEASCSPAAPVWMLC